MDRATLTSVGIADKDSKPTTLQKERERIRNFIESKDQLNWMIEYQGKVVGSVWVNLRDAGSLPAPSIHIMIGDPDARGKGIGFAATDKVIDYIKNKGFDSIYSRHLTSNVKANSLLQSLGFTKFNEAYTDNDGLEWQDVKKNLADA